MSNGTCTSCRIGEVVDLVCDLCGAEFCRTCQFLKTPKSNLIERNCRCESSGWIDLHPVPQPGTPQPPHLLQEIVGDVPLKPAAFEAPAPREELRVALSPAGLRARDLLRMIP